MALDMAGESEGASGGESDGFDDFPRDDDDRAFDFDDQTAQKDVPGIMIARSGVVRCNWSILVDEPEDEQPVGKKAKTEADLDATAAAELQDGAATTERFQLKGPNYDDRNYVGGDLWHSAIVRAIGISLVSRLAILRVDDFPGAGDPVFGTRRELRRRFRAPDLFARLTGVFAGGARCGLKRLSLHGGFMSAESLMVFLRVARPPLESFRCRRCLFHGRNFEAIVESLRSSILDAGALEEFETDAYVGGQDPFGLIARSFPNLRMLRARRIFGKTDRLAALRELPRLQMNQCRFPKSSHKLRGRPAVGEKGIVYWGITSEFHDDGYEGHGLWWDELENSCECMLEWHVGRGVTQEQCFEFMEECGIDLDEELEDEDCGISVDRYAPASDDEQDIIIAQLELRTVLPDEVAISATTIHGRVLAKVSLDPNNTLIRTLFEELAPNYPCSREALRLVLPNGSSLDVIVHGSRTLASVLE